MGLIKNQDPKARIVGRVFIVFILALLLNYMWVVIASRMYLVVNAAILGKTLTNEIVMQLFSTPLFLFLMALYNVLIAVAVFLFWRRYDQKEFSQMGIVWDGRASKLLVQGMLWAFAAMLVMVGAGLITGALQYTGTGFGQFGTGTVINTLIFGIFTFAVIAFGEEVLYRGYIQNNFLDASDTGTAIFFAAALYVFGHITICHDTFDFINIFLFGLILGYAYLKTHSLYISIGFHFIWRFFNTVVFNLQNLDGNGSGVSLFTLQSKGDFFLMNKRWGTRLELITFLVELAILLLLYFTTKKQQESKSKKKSRKK